MNTFFAPRFKLGWILILIAAINAFGWTLFRWNYENSQRGAQITVDYEDTRTMADAFGIDHEEFLRELKSRGVSSLGLYQLSLANLRDNGRISILSREEAARLYPNVNWASYEPYYRYFVTTDDQALNRQLQERLTPQSPVGQKLQPVGKLGFLIPASKQLLNDAQAGFDPQQIAFSKKLGMVVTARISNALNMDLPRAEKMLDDAKAAGAKVVIFSEDEVLGYNSMIRNIAQAMQKRGLLFGNIEFSKQRGWEGFSARTDGQLVRVHSVGPDEASKSQPEVLTERFVRAVKERDIRVAYVRLLRHFKGEYAPAPEGGEPVLKKSALQQNYDFIEGVARELQNQPLPMAFLRPGMTLGTAQEFGNYPATQLGGGSQAVIIRYIGLFLSSLGMVGAALLLLNLFFDFTPAQQTRWALAGIAIAIIMLLLDLASAAVHTGAGGVPKVLGMWPTAFGIKLMAMGIGCFFSAIGILWGGLPKIWDNFGDSKGGQSTSVSSGAAWKTGVATLFKTSALTLIGPLLIIALLNHWRFFSGTDKFFFPKLTQLVPLLIIGLAFAGEAFPHRVISQGAVAARERARAWFNSLLDQPFTARVAMLSGLLAIAGFVWIARTGNDSGMEVSSLELKMRATLEQLFITRPRTKEIFLGNPAMIFAVYFALRRWWLPAFGATIVMTIGQAGMLNTFCHLHTPLFYSLLRTIHGLWLGAVIGGVLLWIYHTKVASRKTQA